ncbi:hypothetical protein NW762_010017 [Fusarium torreyae]|uniref:Uncharacterized protein n=1 Tax=Fusarium torreyae TaxID=1237075 RepID=A0A9W8RU28_9HYPO|nr:hypothetical protein NW762_010017 [Fusarium torreyae]
MPLLVPDLENINNEAQIQPPKHAMGDERQPEERGETSDRQNEPRAYFDTLGNTYTSIPSGYHAVVVSWMVTLTGDDKGASTSNEIATAPIRVSILKPITHESLTEPESTVSETSSFSSSEEMMFSTITVTDIMPSIKTWSTSYATSQSLEAPPTSTIAAGSPRVPLSTVEWIGIVVGIVSVLALIFIAVIILLRRRHTQRPADSQNNINIQLDNVPPPRSGWDTSRSQSVSRYTDSRELKTNFVPQRVGPGSLPPNYDNLNQRYWAGDYQEYNMGVRGTEGEASGSRNAEGYSSAVYNDPKWKGKQREEY